VAGTQLPDSQVLHLLSVHGSVEQVIDSRIVAVTRSSLSTDSLACIRYGLDRLRLQRPDPPVAAALLMRLRHVGVKISIEEARELAEEVLSAFSNGSAATSAAVPERTSEEVSAAFSYASAIVRNGHFPELPSEDRSIRDALDERDLDLVETFFVFRSELILHRRTPEMLVERWRSLTKSIQDGSLDSLDEFLNDLDARDVLEDAAALASPQGRGVFRQHLDQLDARYEMATRQADSTLRDDDVWRPMRWWWYRRPIKMTPALETALRRLRLT
jgi:hypothetical protein